jgi:ferredoxin-NADP reductase
VLVHGVRRVSELAYADFIERQLPQHEYLGELLRDKLMYYPTVTREPFRRRGRLTELLRSVAHDQARDAASAVTPPYLHFPYRRQEGVARPNPPAA